MNAEKAEASAAPPAKPVKTLEVTPKQYAARLNALLKKAKLNYRVDGGSITKGEVNDVLNAPIGKHAALVAGISKKNGKVLDILVMGSGDGTPASGLEIMMVVSAALAASTEGGEFSKVFQELPNMIEGKELVEGNVKLGAKKMDQLGTWFFASPVDNEAQVSDNG